MISNFRQRQQRAEVWRKQEMKMQRGLATVTLLFYKITLHRRDGSGRFVRGELK